MHTLPSPQNYHRLNDHDFNNLVLQQRRRCVVYCYSNRTGESSILEATIERTIPAYPSLLFCRINIDESPQTARMFSIDSRQHTLLLFHNGKVVDWHFGIIPKRVFRAKLDHLVQIS